MDIFDPIVNALTRLHAKANQLRVTLADNLMTGTTHPRLRVDVAQTGFFEGREFRTFREFNIPNGTTLVVEVDVNVNTILFDLELSVDSGGVRLSTIAGATPGGSFDENLPIINKNRMTGTPVYAAQNTLKAGGTITGGTTIDIVRLVAAGGQSSTVSAVGGPNDERGVEPGLYYFKFETLGAGPAVGVFHANWEERP